MESLCNFEFRELTCGESDKKDEKEGEKDVLLPLEFISRNTMRSQSQQRRIHPMMLLLVGTEQ